jgi:hypothetical protein
MEHRYTSQMVVINPTEGHLSTLLSTLTASQECHGGIWVRNPLNMNNTYCHKELIRQI